MRYKVFFILGRIRLFYDRINLTELLVPKANGQKGIFVASIICGTFRHRSVKVVGSASHSVKDKSSRFEEFCIGPQSEPQEEVFVDTSRKLD